MSIIAWIIIGFVAGLIARAIMPGPQPMGLVMTTLLGIVGSVIGGIIGHAVWGRGASGWTPGGLILSAVGALVVLFILGLVQRRPTRARV